MSAMEHEGLPIDDLDSEESVIAFRPGKEHLGERLDRYVAAELADYSRSYVQGLIESGHVLVDGVQRKSKFRITPGEVVSVEIPPLEADEILPDAIPLDVIYEDSDVIVIDKPAGMVVHPAPGHPRGTLANALFNAASPSCSTVARCGNWRSA